MSILIIKKGTEFEFADNWDYPEDNQEKHLHSIVEEKPQFITTDEERKPTRVIGSKMRLGSEELDLLLVNNEGELTIAELKRNKTPRDVIAQILDYDSVLRNMSLDELESKLNTSFKTLKDVFNEFKNNDELPSPEFTLSEFKENVKSTLKNIDLVVVSYEISEDIERNAKSLNERGIPISCVEFEYYKKGDVEYFVPKVIVGGEEKVKPVEKKKTEIMKKYYAFFEYVITEFKSRKPGVTQRGSTYDSWMQLPCGYGGAIHFEWGFTKREPNKYLNIGLNFENSDKKVNLKLLEYFKNKKSIFEEKIGEKLVFQEYGKNWAWIVAKRPVGTIEKAINSDKIKRWVVDTMIKFYDTLKPELDEFVPKMS